MAGVAGNYVIAKSRIPILFIHGDADDFVPYYMADELYEACQSEKKLVMIEGARHFESCYLNPDEYEKAIEDFIFPIME